MKTTTKSQNFLTGALLISLGGLLAKILGALYRIPLTNIIGSYGMGLYQLVFPPYILFLTVCQAGVPVAMSRLTAQNAALADDTQNGKVFRYCFRLLLLLGFAGMLVLVALSSSIAQMQGNPDTTMAFIIVAPALLFVPITNVLKAYFQGRMNMLPSSATTVIEQLVKLSVGLLLATHFMPDVNKAVLGAVLAITISELTSLVIMSIVFATNRRGQPKLPTLMKGDARDIFKQTFTLALPVALGAFVMQMSQVIDSVMVVNLLSVANETSLYGLWTGPVNSMLGLPIALSAGVAVSALPSITRTFVTNDREKLNSSFNSAFKLTIVIGTPCAFGMIMLSRPIISLLYGGLAAEEIHVAGLLLAISGLSILFLSIMQTSVSVLQAVGKPYVSVYIIAGAIVVKAVVNLLLLPIDSINIYGAALSETLCYLFSTVCVMIYLSTKLKLKIQLSETVLKPVAASLIMTLGLTLLITFAENFVATKIGTLMSIGIAGLLYLASLWVLRVFSEAELNLLPKRRREVS